jgi:hypothetical protein
MPICLLAEAFADMRRNERRSLCELISQLRISSKAGSLEDRRNCIRGIEGRLKNFEIFEAFRTHISDEACFVPRLTTND